MLAGAVVLALAAAGASVAFNRTSLFRQARTDLVTHTVRPDRLELTIVERGALESADNRDVFCRVKAGAKNSTIATTIKAVIDDGSTVKKGDLLVELDDSGLQEQLKTQKQVVDKAEADRIQAEENYKIVQSQNESAIKTAEVDLELKRIDLQKYLEGDYPQAIKDVEGRMKIAESDVEQQRDRAAWSLRMVKKGYQTVSQGQAEQSKLESLEIALKKVREEKRVLTDPQFGVKKREVTDRANKVSEAERALSRAKAEALAKEVQARTTRETNKSLHEQAKAAYEDIEDEIKKCKIVAPQDGMVVYYVPEQARFGGGSQQSIVAQGEPVREGQKLMQIPDLRRMLVNTRVHEAMVSRVVKEQRATVRVDAYPDRIFPAHVESVATISSQQDWMSSDVKVYATKVAIDEMVQGLKPGMSAEVTIEVGEALENVLTVPVQAIVGSVEMGSQRRCYVMTMEGPEPRDVIVGMSNERMAEIKEGLREGEEVVLNPKTLAGDAYKPKRAGKGSRSNGKGAATKEGAGTKEGGVDGSKNGDAPPPATARPRPESGKSASSGKSGKGGDDRQKRQQEMLERFRSASPEERKQMLEQVPEEYRGKVKERLKAAGVDLKD